jgi:hypothetical protein
MKIKLGFTLLPTILLGELALGQTHLADRSAAFPRFFVHEGHLDSDKLPTSGAELCLFEKRDHCFQMPATGNNGVIFEFGLKPLSERLPLIGGGSWIFFSSMFYGGGSGTSTRLAILRYDTTDGHITNLLPEIAVSNVSERAVWNIAGASQYPILVVADFIWAEGEGHFSPHHYKIEAWKFDYSKDRYVSAFSYRTSTKYDGGDSAPVRVLGLERMNILHHLGTAGN